MMIGLFRRKKRPNYLCPSWKGCKVENITDIIFEKELALMSDRDWESMLEKVTKKLELYYVSIKATEKSEECMVQMLSRKQMETFRNTLRFIVMNDVNEAIREWVDFIRDCGRYKMRRLSQFETYLIYVLAREMLYMIRTKILEYGINT